jgi:hypothetical protein
LGGGGGGATRGIILKAPSQKIIVAKDLETLFTGMCDFASFSKKYLTLLSRLLKNFYMVYLLLLN